MNRRTNLLVFCIFQRTDRQGRHDDQGQTHPQRHFLWASEGVSLPLKTAVQTAVHSLEGRASSITSRPGIAAAGEGSEDPTTFISQESSLPGQIHCSGRGRSHYSPATRNRQRPPDHDISKTCTPARNPDKPTSAARPFEDKSSPPDPFRHRPHGRPAVASPALCPSSESRSAAGSHTLPTARRGAASNRNRGRPSDPALARFDPIDAASGP